MDAWVGIVIGTVIGGFLTAGATILATELRARHEKEERQRDREEAYRRLVSEKLLEKLLEAYEKGFSYCSRLWGMIASYEGLEGIGPVVPVKDRKEIVDLALEATDWYDSSCLHLDEVSRKEMLSALHSVQEDYLYVPEKHRDVMEPLEKLVMALKAIEAGIEEMKHMEKPKKELSEDKP